MIADDDESRQAGEEQAGSAEDHARRLQRGEPDAVRQVRARVRRALAHGRLRLPAHEREDLEQEIMMQIWQAVNRRDFDPTLGFWGFVEVVTFRRCIDRLRGDRESPLRRPAPPHSGKGPLGHLLERERLRLAKEALASLDPSCRELISRHFEGRKSYRELSDVLGKSEGALRVQMYRCVRKVRRILEKRVAQPKPEREVR